MEYLFLFMGLALAATAAVKLTQKKNEPFDEALRVEVDRPLNRELVALYGLQESVEEALSELEEKKQVNQFLLSRLESQREEIELRLQKLEGLMGRAEAMLSNSPQPSPSEGGRFEHEQIYQLADQGLDLAEIATQMGLGRGEVKLILGLRR